MENNDYDLAEFSKVMWALAEDFGGKITDDSLLLRFAALQEYSVEQIQQAGTWLLKHREQTFPAVPTTKEIIDAIEVTQRSVGDKGSGELQCDIVLQYFKHNWTPYNGYTHTFKHPVTEYLMTNRWSFAKLGKMPSDELKWFRRDFVKAWEELAKDKETIALLPGTKDVQGLKSLANQSVRRLT